MKAHLEISQIGVSDATNPTDLLAAMSISGDVDDEHSPSSPLTRYTVSIDVCLLIEIKACAARTMINQSALEGAALCG